MMTLAQAAAWMAQTLPQVQYGSAAAAEGAQHLALQRVHTDSRSVQHGDLLIALCGGRLVDYAAIMALHANYNMRAF